MEVRSKKLALNTLFSLLEELVAIICGFILPRLILSAFGSKYNGITTSITQFLSCAVLLRAGIGGVTRAALYKPLANHDKNKIDSKGMSAINKIKLYGHGLLQYAKTANSKIKTKIMNMNSGGDRLGRAIKAALISDRKEAIIKGSIIPSFHKCIMIAVGLAGLWTFNPPLAIISAVGGFAVSKKLTKKERALMYDDVLIELKIVDKELQMAEDKNQIKKMRELMRIRKELERTAARIKVGATVGKDVIPGGYTMFRRDE